MLKIKQVVLIVTTVFTVVSCDDFISDEALAIDGSAEQQTVQGIASTVNVNEGINTVQQEEFYLTAEDGEQIPVILLKPSNVGTFPCVLEIHGVTGQKEAGIIEDLSGKVGNLTTQLLNSGFAVVVFDLRYHGERKPRDYANFDEHFNDVVANWGTIYPNTISDILVIHDYLKERDDLQTEKLNLFGYSMGGMFTFSVAAAYPERINAACAAATPIFTEQVTPGSPQLVAEQIQNVPFSMIAATLDPWYTIQQAQWVHQLIASPNKSLHIYGSGHDLPTTYIYGVNSWFVNNK